MSDNNGFNNLDKSSSLEDKIFNYLVNLKTSYQILGLIVIMAISFGGYLIYTYYTEGNINNMPELVSSFIYIFAIVVAILYGGMRIRQRRKIKK